MNQDGKEELKQSCDKKTYIIDKIYKVVCKLGVGSFGSIYKATNIQTQQFAAIKMSKPKNKEASNPMTQREFQILSNLQNNIGISTIYSHGYYNDLFYIVMQYLGCNLEQLLKQNQGKFSIPTTAMIGYQMIERMEMLHKKNYLHRDIKPENFLIGDKKNKNIIYLIDFGLSKPYLEKDHKHIPYRENKGLVGTARYASINAHKGIELSRRDDLEAIGYLLIYFLKGSLPWQSLQISDKMKKFEQIMELKVKTPVNELCSQLPEELQTYLTYCKQLQFSEKPDYQKLKNLFLTMLFDN